MFFVKCYFDYMVFFVVRKYFIKEYFIISFKFCEWFEKGCDLIYKRLCFFVNFGSIV